MAKARTLYVCQQCDHQSSGYYGRCPECGAWGSMVETINRPASSTGKGGQQRSSRSASGAPTRLSEITSAGVSRRSIPIAEVSRVLGGGIVPGSLVLVGGDPGIGKSTLLLQCAGALAAEDARVLYVTAEESEQQVKLRADRLGIRSDNLYLYSETEIGTVIDAAEKLQPAVTSSTLSRRFSVPKSRLLPGASVRFATARHGSWISPNHGIRRSSLLGM